MRKRKTLQITNHHGWAVKRLQAFERTPKNANMANQVVAIRLVMQKIYGDKSG